MQTALRHSHLLLASWPSRSVGRKGRCCSGTRGTNCLLGWNSKADPASFYPTDHSQCIEHSTPSPKQGRDFFPRLEMCFHDPLKAPVPVLTYFIGHFCSGQKQVRCVFSISLNFGNYRKYQLWFQVGKTQSIKQLCCSQPSSSTPPCRTNRARDPRGISGPRNLSPNTYSLARESKISCEGADELSDTSWGNAAERTMFKVLEVSPPTGFICTYTTFHIYSCKHLVGVNKSNFSSAKSVPVTQLPNAQPKNPQKMSPALALTARGGQDLGGSQPWFLWPSIACTC